MCGPQLADIEDGIWAEFQDDGVLLYGVNTESESILTDFVDQVGLTFPVLRSEPAGYTLLGGLSPFPRDFIIDPDGIVQYAAVEYRPTEMSTIIERFLPTGIGVDEGGGTPGARLPRGFRLGQNFPNPFNPSTTIRFEIDRRGGPAPVDLSIFSLRGRRVRSLVSSAVPDGVHHAHWDGTDDRGLPLPSGTYMYRLRVGDDQAVRRMLLAR